VRAEGWYVDPYQLHDARWFSDGTPTSLVRDGEVESHDPPPDTPFTGPLEPFVGTAPSGADDLRRADKAELPEELSNPVKRAFDVCAQFPPSY